MTLYRPSTVTLTLVSDAHGNVGLRTDLATPGVGSPVSPVQSVALDLINSCARRGLEVIRGAEHVPALSLALDLTSPDQYGWSVPSEVAAVARKVVLQSQHHQQVVSAAAAAGGAL